MCGKLVGKFGDKRTVPCTHEWDLSGVAYSRSANEGAEADESISNSVDIQEEIVIHIRSESGELGAAIYKSLQEAAERGLIPKII